MKIFDRIESISEDGIVLTDNEILVDNKNKKLTDILAYNLLGATGEDIYNYVFATENSRTQLFLCLESYDNANIEEGKIYFYDSDKNILKNIQLVGVGNQSDINKPELFTNLVNLASESINAGSIEMQYTFISHTEPGGTLYILVDGTVAKTVAITNVETNVTDTTIISDLLFGQHTINVYAIDSHGNKSDTQSATINIILA